MQTDRQTRIVCLFLTLLLLFLIFPTEDLLADTELSDCYSIMDDYSFEVDTNVITSWNNHANVEFIVRNTGDKTIDNWYLTFCTAYTIDNIWNAAISETDGKGTYTIRNALWNQDIAANSEVVFGMTLSSKDSNIDTFPDWYLLNVNEKIVEPEKYTITYQEYSKWEDNFSGAIAISSLEVIEDWSINCVSDFHITDASNCIVSQDDNRLCIMNDGILSNIDPLQPLYISVQGISTDGEFQLIDIEMKSISLAYNLSEDEDYNGIPDVFEYINEQVEEPITTTPTPELSIIPTEEITEPPSTEPSISYEEDSYIDSDEDGLNDFVEEIYGTDKEKTDSDDDLINDYLELVFWGTNPNASDSDNNGISDADEDFDKDGISNIMELNLGTDPLSEDSDCDGLTDYQEINVYETDPSNNDSNYDGITDGDAIYLGFDPGSNDSDANGISDCEEKIYQNLSVEIKETDFEHDVIQKVEVEGNVSNRIDSVFTIENVYGKHMYSSDVPYLVGVPINIECSSSFDKLTITFFYDESKLGETNEGDLGIRWVDEESGMLIDVESVVDEEEHSISFSTEHLCDWIVCDTAKEYLFWNSTAKGYSTNHDTADWATREGTIYTLMVQFGMLVSDVEKERTIQAISELMDYIDEKDSVTVIAYNSTDCWEQYNYLVLGEWIPEYCAKITRIYHKEDKDELVTAVNEILSGNYKANYYSNLMVDPLDPSRNYYNFWYNNNNHIDADKENEAIEQYTNSLYRLLWCYSDRSCTYHGMGTSTNLFSADEDYYHNLEHENVAIYFSNGSQQLTVDTISPLEKNEKWAGFNSFFLNYKKSNLQLYIVNTSDHANPINLDLDKCFAGDKGKNEFRYGLWPYTHGGMINLCEDRFLGTISKLRRLNAGSDKDADELWDINEERGMVCANGRIAYSNSNTKHSDEDGISDTEEMGRCYTILKHGEEITVNGRLIDKEDQLFGKFFAFSDGIWTIYAYHSNPLLTDSDGDYYYDQNDEKPLNNCLETYDLGGGDYEPLYLSENGNYVMNDDGYIHVKNVPYETNPDKGFYGGNQGWFYYNSFDDVIDINGKKIKYSVCEYDGYFYPLLSEGGCGLIATNDVILYLTNGITTYDYNSEYIINFFSTIKRSESYSSLVDEDLTENLIAVAPILPKNICDLFYGYGYSCFTKSIYNFNENDIIKLVISSITQNKPVILNEFDVVGMIQNACIDSSESKEKEGFPLYSLNVDDGMGLCGNPDKYNVMTDHYVTITGVVKDTQSGKTWLRIQSWGEVYYILYSDFVLYNSTHAFEGAKGMIIVVE